MVYTEDCIQFLNLKDVDEQVLIKNRYKRYDHLELQCLNISICCSQNIVVVGWVGPKKQLTMGKTNFDTSLYCGTAYASINIHA